MKSEKRLIQLLLSFIVCCIISCSNDETFIDEVLDGDGQESFDTDNDVDTDDSSSGDDSNNDTTDNSQEGEGEITSYTVNGSSIVKLKDFEVTGASLEFQNDVAKHQEIWELTKKVIPESELSKISEFLVFSGEATQTAGFVVPVTNDLTKWQYAIAIDFAYEGGFNSDGELLHTIIHEFGHVLTLNNEQLDPTINQEDCTNFFPGEGCANSDAYINLLQTQFWADIWNEFQQIESEESRAAFFTKYQDRYHTEYASTNPGEDIAEVFAAFVIRSGGANGTSIAEQKIQLMYDAEALTELRDFIRSSGAVAKGASIFPSNISNRKPFCGTSRKLANAKL